MGTKEDMEIRLFQEIWLSEKGVGKKQAFFLNEHNVLLAQYILCL